VTRRDLLRHIASRTLVCATSMLMLSACTLFHPIGPDARSPTPPSGDGKDPTAAGASIAAADAHHFSADPLPGKWWQLYDDPSLNDIVTEALAQNRDLRSTAATLEGARSALDEARAAWLPTTALDVSDERERGNEYGVAGLHRHNAAAASLDISYEVDLFGRIRRTVEAAHATYEAQQYAFAAAQLQLVANTVTAYALVCQDNQSLATTQRLIDLTRGQLDVTRKLAQFGAASNVDVLRAQAQMQTQQATLPTIRGQRQSALFALAILLGRPPTQYPASAASCMAPPRIQQALPVGDGMALLRRRPDVAEAERKLASATAEIGVAMAAVYPQVSLGVGVGGEGTSLSGAMRATGRTWDFGPMIHWTFPNVVIALAQVKGQEASAHAALAMYDQTVLTALKEADSALDSYARALEHDAALRQTRDTDREAYTQVQRLYLRGSSPYLDVLTAQQTLIDVEQQLVSSNATVSSDQVQVFQALGGGWGGSAQQAAIDAQAQATAAAQRYQAVAVKAAQERGR